MKTMRSEISKLTNPEAIMKVVRKIMREVDPEYLAEEKAFEEGVRAIKEKKFANTTVCIDDVITAENKRMAGNILFLFWRGLHLNLECFKDFTKQRFVDMDYEDIHQETLMNSMPHGEDGYRLSEEFARALPVEERDLDEPITSYYSYLATSAYKIVHYLGFLAGESFLQFVEPGYVPSESTKYRYARDVEEYLNISLPID